MTKRKKGLAGDEFAVLSKDERLERAERRIIDRYGDYILGEALIDLGTGRRVDEFEQAMESLKWAADDEAEIFKAFEDWLEPYINADIGWRVRFGRKGKGERREIYDGKPIPSRAELRAKVLAVHNRQKTWSYHRVCLRVAEAFGYTSAWSVKEACREHPAIKWPDPRRPKT